MQCLAFNQSKACLLLKTSFHLNCHYSDQNVEKHAFLFSSPLFSLAVIYQALATLRINKTFEKVEWHRHWTLQDSELIWNRSWQYYSAGKARNVSRTFASQLS